MKLENTIIAWTPGTAEVECGPYPDRNGWSRQYRMTSGMCYTSWHDTSPVVRALLMFIEFNAIVVRDRVNPEAAHQAFLAIDEYRELIPEDQAGAYRGEMTEIHKLMLAEVQV